MELILTNIQSVFTTAVGMIGTIGDAIAGATDGVLNNPLLLLYAIVPLVGIGVGLFRRLINVN